MDKYSLDHAYQGFITNTVNHIRLLDMAEHCVAEWIKACLICGNLLHSCFSAALQCSLLVLTLNCCFSGPLGLVVSHKIITANAEAIQVLYSLLLYSCVVHINIIVCDKCGRTDKQTNSENIKQSYNQRFARFAHTRLVKIISHLLHSTCFIDQLLEICRPNYSKRV